MFDFHQVNQQIVIVHNIIQQFGFQVFRAKLEKNCSLLPLGNLTLGCSCKFQDVFQVLPAKTVLLELSYLHPLVVVVLVVLSLERFCLVWNPVVAHHITFRYLWNLV